MLAMTMGCGFCCHVSLLPVLYFLPFGRRLIQFSPAGPVSSVSAESRHGNRSAAERKRPSLHPEHSVIQTQSTCTHSCPAHTLCRRVSSWTSLRFPSPTHKSCLQINCRNIIIREEERIRFQNRFSCLGDNTLMQSRIKQAIIAQKQVWFKKSLDVWSKGNYLVQVALSLLRKHFQPQH